MKYNHTESTNQFLTSLKAEKLNLNASWYNARGRIQQQLENIVFLKPYSNQAFRYNYQFAGNIGNRETC